MSPVPPEMRAMFASECEDYLAKLTEGFLALEREPGAPGVVDSLFRVAHSLKGTCRVTGCHDLAKGAHALEDLLARLKSGKLCLQARQYDSLSGVINQFGELLSLTLASRETKGALGAILSALSHCQASTVVEPSVLVEETAPRNKPFLDVIKVPSARLDTLINRVGELLPVQQRMQVHMQQCSELRSRLEELSRRSGLSQDLHLALLQIAGQAQTLHQGLEEEERRMEQLFEALQGAVLQTRMVPLSQLFNQIPKWMRDLTRTLGRSAELTVSGGDLELDKRIVEGLRDPMLHLVRNALDHGIESPEQRLAKGKAALGNLRLSALQERDGVSICLSDDGAGLDLEAIREKVLERGLAEAALWGEESLIKMLFQPGFSMKSEVSEISGRGVGLDAVVDQLSAIKGHVELSGRRGQGCTARVWVPRSLTGARVMHLECAGLNIGVPSTSVLACLKNQPGLIQGLGAHLAALYEGHPVMLAPLAHLVGHQTDRGTEIPYVVILEAAGERVALGVDALLGELAVLQKPLPERLQFMTAFYGMSILGSGRILLLADPAHLVSQAKVFWQSESPAQRSSEKAASVKRILLADDSLTTRVQLRRILESAGYKVHPAVDGLDAWARLTAQPFDAVVSDVQMPGMDGIALAQRIRATPSLAHLPIVLVTTLGSEDDLRRGMEAGASAYLPKGSFDQERLLASLRRLL